MDQYGQRLKCEKPIGSKDVVPWKMKGWNEESTTLESELVASEEVRTLDKVQTYKKINDHWNTEISLKLYNDL